MDMNATEILGGLMNFDVNISPFQNVACAFCHMPYAAFSGPIQSVNLTMIAYPGTYHYRAGEADSAAVYLFNRFPVLNTIQHKACSSAETSGMGARPDTS